VLYDLIPRTRTPGASDADAFLLFFSLHHRESDEVMVKLFHEPWLTRYHIIGSNALSYAKILVTLVLLTIVGLFYSYFLQKCVADDSPISRL